MNNLKYINPENINLSIKRLQNLEKGINSYIESNKMFGGEIIVARYGKIGLHKTFGTTDTNREANKEDIYLLMSLSKSFTAILILKAIDEGRLSLNTKISDILPSFAQGNKKNITIFHILTHQGGTYAALSVIPPYTTDDFGDLDKMYNMISNEPIAFPQGERVCYNAIGGYSVLGKVLEAIDEKNRPFSKIAQEELFIPLDMTTTSFGNKEDNVNRVPARYTEKMSTFATSKFASFYDTFANKNCTIPSAGALSTASDLYKFVNAIRKNYISSNLQNNLINHSTHSHSIDSSLKDLTSDNLLISNALFEYARKNHCNDMTNDFWDYEAQTKGLAKVPAMFNLLGGYVRGTHHFTTGAGFSASPNTIYSVGGGSTMWMYDPVQDLIVVLLTSGFIEGLSHFERICYINDLALSCCF